ncbi:S41 family peptidase [Sporomusa aerivorans]|uniref:S41 family peptidase n=1 Tax=Sporomusa aerivorans TaxID=204936 RepID=UPI00352B9AB3
MSRRKLVFGAVLLVLVTFLVTSAGFLYLMNAWSSDVVSTIRVLRALQVVKSRYVEEVPVETLMAGSIKGMVNSLNDPHSVYMDAKMFKEFMIETEGSFGGVGIVIGTKDKQLTVVAPIEGTPGEQAGIKSGDQIIKIDGQDTKDLALDEAVNKIRGPEGSQVVLTISRGQEIQDYTLTRSNIQIKTVAGKMLENNIGYIRISMFNENTGNDFVRKLQELEKQGLKAIVLDLRDNPGGLLDESVKVASQLVPKGPVVSVVTRDGRRETHSSNLAAPKYPVAVLVNGGSASASEIVAGAVQDTGVGTLIGTKTYGKGSVQTVIRLDEGSAIKLTIAKYLTPKDRSINGVGIEPDIKIELPETRDKDVQLDKAIEVLKGKM